MIKFPKEKILQAALETLRKGMGLNARNIAQVLGCSTQPIYSVFKNMDEIKLALRDCAGQIQKKKVENFLQQNILSYKAYGMGFVRFAKDEKALFKFLYMQEPSQLFAMTEDFLYDEIIQVMQKAYGFSKAQAKQFHLDMSIYTYGLAVLQSIGHNMTDKEVDERLTVEFHALLSGVNKK